MNTSYTSQLQIATKTILATLVVMGLFAASVKGVCSNECVWQQESAVEFGTSFEEDTAGVFSEFETAIGTWNKVIGNVLIDNKHAKSGKQCLQIAGGEQASVELKIADGVKADGQLSFWAERWTVRSPFSFRIEKQSGGQWSEIYNGDKEIRVGRAFLSQIRLPLGDNKITRLRFSVSSPENTGILIDDLKIVPAVPMKVTNVDVVPLALPALVGAEQSAIVKLKVQTAGILNPVSIRQITASLIDESSERNIKSLQPFFGGSDSNFHWDEPLGKATKPQKGKAQTFFSNRLLSEGDNYIWLACQLKKNADIEATIAARIESITFSDGTTIETVSQPSVQRLGVSVRDGGNDGVHTYRIPGLATTNQGTLIGVYDIRWDGSGDLPGNIDVGMSRSTDGGRTWEPMKTIMDMGDDPKWRGEGIGDPTVLVDRETGTIWVAATWSHGNRSWNGSGPGLEPAETGQWILVKSDDDGVTWSNPINITKQIKNPNWSFLLQGPGKGITMSDGKIVFPAQYQDPPNKSNKQTNRLPHSTFIYSDDHGETWSIATGAWDDTTESQIVELANGLLMLNCRNNRSSKRAIMTTADMGRTWSKHSTHLKDLIEPGSCMASLINVGRELGWRNIPSKCNNQFLLFSNPDSLRGRNHMTIKASTDSGATWPAKHHLLLDEQDGRGYSCMTMIDADTVGILYEGSQAHMTFQRIKLDEILNPRKEQKTKNPAQTHRKKEPGTRSDTTNQNNGSLLPKADEKNDDLRFARPFGDHMVLQANQPIRIWGTGKPGARVQVKMPLSKTRKSAQIDHLGNWEFELKPLPINRTGQSIVLSSRGQSISIKDVLIGDVWICAGQSNMEWELRNSSGGTNVVSRANDNLIRLHNCPAGVRGSNLTYSEKQMVRLLPERFSKGQWQVDSPKSSAPFSAVGYYFAKHIRKELDIPIGLINVSVGGTPIESWVSPSRLKQDPNLARMFRGNWLDNPFLGKWCRDRARTNLKHGLEGQFEIPGNECGPNHSFKPGFMFEAGIKPFSPLSIRGAIWYQGESNADTPERSRVYDNCFPLLVEDWREHFRNEDLPVIFVQLPSMGRANWPVFREYQRRSLAKLNNVGMAITIDTGHPTNVHPREKAPIGRRLAHWALVKTYHQKGIPMGPLFKSKAIGGERLEIAFDYSGAKLATHDGQPPNHFEIAGVDGVYHPADANIVDNKIHLTSHHVLRPMHARYAWSAFPDPTPNLINSEGLPASPFTTEKEFH